MTIRERAQRLLDALGLTDSELSLLLTDDEEIHQLNRDFRSVDAPTDVLSFALNEPSELRDGFDGMLGDVVISVETAERQAQDHYHQDRLERHGAWTLADEVSFLLVHGLLHLIGYDHEDDDQTEKMKAKEMELFHLCAE